MYKSIIALIAAATMLTACNNNGVDENSTEVTEESVKQEKEASLPEYDKIIELIDNPDFTFRTVTDNEDKRILFLVDKNGKKKYKSIFVKNTNRLKIIKINRQEGLVFNDTIG